VSFVVKFFLNHKDHKGHKEKRKGVRSVKPEGFHAMKHALVRCCLFVVLAAAWFPGRVWAQGDLEARVGALESRVTNLKLQVADIQSSIRQGGSEGALAFLFGVFCALWAQNTGRSAWLWFFMGLLFNVFTVIVLLSKNSGDRAARSP
jgi:hypothetical protein